MFHSLKCGGNLPGGQLDVYRKTPGYYSRCEKEILNDTVRWNRSTPLLSPDGRVGFPWTVKDWDIFWSKKT